jgi:hypothetical protein
MLFWHSEPPRIFIFLRCSDVECGSDALSDSDDDDEKSNKIKSLASITINKKPSIFDTPSSCFMAMGPKVQYDECNNGSKSEDEEPSKEELIELLQEAHSLMNKKREEFKELCKRHKPLISF